MSDGRNEDKFAMSLGVWELPRFADYKYDIKPRLGDNRAFRRIMMNQKTMNNNLARMEEFDKWFITLIARDYPADPVERIEEFVEFASTELFEDTMVKFRWTTKEKLEESRRDSLKDLKKLTGDN